MPYGFDLAFTGRDEVVSNFRELLLLAVVVVVSIGVGDGERGAVSVVASLQVVA
jgi:hypothetical protein